MIAAGAVAAVGIAATLYAGQIIADMDDYLVEDWTDDEQ